MKSITPDGITGMIFALEGVKNSLVLLNGPMGCRFYHSTTSQFLSIHPLLYLPAGESGEKVPVDYNYLNDWFFRQQRVPCTYLDGYDYVYGTKDKVSRALDFIRENVSCALLAVINSPGAALIGDELSELAREKMGDIPVVTLESPGWSTSFELGCSEASLALLKQLGPALRKSPEAKKSGAKKKVNILGLSIWQRYMQGDRQELERLFALCGVEVSCCLCAESSLDEIAAMPDADLNAVLCPEMGLAAAQYLKERFGTEYYVCPVPPIGFSATERVFADICALLGVSDEAVREQSERARALAWYKINAVHHQYGKPKGVKFYVECSPSFARGYREFFTGYFGMQESEAAQAELVFADANLIAALMLENKSFCGIEVSLPGMGYIDLVPKTHLGTQGALFLTEQVLNGLMHNL